MSDTAIEVRDLRYYYGKTKAVDGISFDVLPGKVMGFLGLLAGVAIAIGVPWVVLTNAAHAELGSVASTLLSIVGIVGGVALAIVATFFSIVIPKKVGSHSS